jgi:uncharacterized damage-inducible protein DinB
MTAKASRGSVPIDLLFEDFDAELTSTRRVLERFPDGKGDWRPHAKSRTLAELATHVTDIPGLGATILETDELDALKRPPRTTAASAAELLERLDANAMRLRAALAAADEARLAGEWTMRAGDHVFVKRPRRSLLRVMFASHMVHHRAQLGVYLRLLDVPVPGVYGPSADEGLST